jgi:hypothetical protein
VLAILVADMVALAESSTVFGSGPGSSNAPTVATADHTLASREGVIAIRRVDGVAHVAIAATADPTAAPPQPVTTTTRPAPPPARNFLLSADGTLRTGVGIYTDCSGNTPLPRYEAAIDTCARAGVSYFVGHNVGVFTPLMHMGVGSVLTWWDEAGGAHVLRVVAVHNWTHSSGFPPPTRADVIAQFQTCVTEDGSTERILDAQAA